MLMKTKLIFLSIAAANQAMDDNWSTSPFNLRSGNRFHFMTPVRAETRVIDAISSRDLVNFGSALHSLQDTFSHFLKGYTWQHVSAGNSPDDFQMCPNREDVIQATLDSLRALCAMLGR
jgi:hypothetical protein